MYNNLNLYYLNQIGITPWIIREEALIVPRLIILTSEKITGKAQDLLKKMIAYLNVSEEDFILFQLKDKNKLEEEPWFSMMQADSSTILLSLGLDILNAYKGRIISSLNPNHLLHHPKDKRQVFKDLNTIQKMLANSSL